MNAATKSSWQVLEGYLATHPMPTSTAYSGSGAATYRFGFNGKEKDDEIHGSTGTSYDFGARLYDPRVGRWLSLDLVASGAPGITPYRFGLNNPVLYSDPTGGFEIPVHKAITQNVAVITKLTDKQTYWLRVGSQNVDYLGFAEDWHFDGRTDFSQVQQHWAEVNARIAARPSWDYYGLGVDLHTVQDFYAHSNYVELYVQYYKDQGGDMANFNTDMVPLYEQGIQDNTFLKNYLEPNLRTGDSIY